MSDFLRAFTKLERTMEFIKMKKIALFSIVALSALMVGCSSTQTRDCDGQACDTAQCEDAANCDTSTCEKPSCDKKAACPTGAKACPTGAKKACDADCTKPCCATACAHPNTTFTCPKCKDGKPCCADCAAKAAAGCSDCKVG